MSLTIVTRSRSSVRVAGEHDRGGRRGLVALSVTPRRVPAQLTRSEARQVARAIMQFAASTGRTR